MNPFAPVQSNEPQLQGGLGNLPASEPTNKRTLEACAA